MEGWGLHKVLNVSGVRCKKNTVMQAKCALEPERFSTDLKYGLQAADSYATLLTIRDESNNNLRANDNLTYQICASLTLKFKGFSNHMKLRAVYLEVGKPAEGGLAW